MRYIAEQAGHGYVHYQCGEVAGEKAVALFEKFDDRYRVLASRGMRDHARSKGRSSARLVMYPKDDTGTWYFWLMATDGEGPVPGAANTADARNAVTRLSWGGQYELVGRPVRRRSGTMHHVWTWVLSQQNYDNWRDRLKTASGRVRSSVERKPDYLVQQLQMLRKVPGFQGINRQKLALVLAADIPRELHDALRVRSLGTVVDKKLMVFSEGRTVRSLLAAV